MGELAPVIADFLFSSAEFGQSWHLFADAPAQLLRFPGSEVVAGLSWNNAGRRYFVDLESGRCTGRVSEGEVRSGPCGLSRMAFAAMNDQDRALVRGAVLVRLTDDPTFARDLRANPLLAAYLEIEIPA